MGRVLIRKKKAPPPRMARRDGAESLAVPRCLTYGTGTYETTPWRIKTYDGST